MDFRTITDTSSKQYSIVNNAIIKNGLLYYDDCICVALGSYFGEVGIEYRVTLENGNQFNVIKADAKADIHIINGCYVAENLNLIEFIIDDNTLDPIAKKMGDISYLNKFDGVITKMERKMK